MVVALLGATCGTDDSTSDDGAEDPVDAAEDICPLMWQWVKDIGEAFNDASMGVAEIDDADGRRARWMTSFDEIEELNARLADDLTELPDGPVLGPLVDQVERDLPRSNEELDDIRRLFEQYPELDEQRHQERTMQLIVRVEKVIDLPKPDLAVLDPDGTVTDAFRRVPSCQHSIRDVDDGSRQSNG
jgi:hypothetical protein